ncbi:MAG: FG-GAP repeat protein [SAR324 cluster bacterium]|nr:FG-GAP repeat protein [SAR324 cluster bacterium]
MGDEFGWGIALSQNHAMIGAWGDDEAGADAGAFYVFE